MLKAHKKTDVAKCTSVIDNIGLLFNEPPEFQVALYLVSRKNVCWGPQIGIKHVPIALFIAFYQLVRKTQCPGAETYNSALFYEPSRPTAIVSLVINEGAVLENPFKINAPKQSSSELPLNTQLR